MGGVTPGCVLGTVLLGSLVGCQRPEAATAPGFPGARSGAPSQEARSQQTDTEIVERLSAARCTREQWCKNVGAGQSYVSEGACLEQMRGTIADDVNASRCPLGIDGVELERCVSAIAREQCNRPVDTMMRKEQCRAAALCLR